MESYMTQTQENNVESTKYGRTLQVVAGNKVKLQYGIKWPWRRQFLRFIQKTQTEIVQNDGWQGKLHLVK